MKRVILFSMPTEGNIPELSKLLFPVEIKERVLAYMPSNGGNTKRVYTDYWKDIAEKGDARFLFVDNMLPESAGEARKIEEANILLISGGNTFELLNNLRNSRLDEAVKQFVQKDEFVLSGFSAGAIVLSPTITTATLPSGNDPNDLIDQNNVGITDLTGLGIISFEILPHFVEEKDRLTLKRYRSKSLHEVKEITDDRILTFDFKQ